MYIELFGYPASGKTTLARTARQHHPHIKTERDVKKKTSIIVRIRPLYLAKLLLFSIRSRYLCKKFINAMIVKQHYFQKYQNDTYLSDHGFIQTLLSHPRLIERILRHPPLYQHFFALLPPGLYLLVNTAKTHSERREQERAKLATLNENQKQRLYNLQEHMIEHILKNQNIKIIRTYKDLKPLL